MIVHPILFSRTGPGRKVIREKTKMFNQKIQLEIFQYGDQYQEIHQAFSGHKMRDIKQLIIQLKDHYNIKVPHAYQRTKSAFFVWLIDNMLRVANCPLIQDILKNQKETAVADRTETNVHNLEDEYPEFGTFVTP